MCRIASLTCLTGSRVPSGRSSPTGLSVVHEDVPGA
jgi:hypothetical protein